MKFTDVYLKADTKAAMFSGLELAGFDITDTPYQPDSEILLLPEGAITQGDGFPVAGYHANVRTTNPDIAVALEPLAVYPKTPSYVWA